MTAPRSNVRLLCLLALLQLGVGPLVILTLSCLTQVTQPVLHSVAKTPCLDSMECRAAVNHWLDEVTRCTLGHENSEPSAPASDDKGKVKFGKTKLWTWCIIAAPLAACRDLQDAVPAWQLQTWTPTNTQAPPGPPPRGLI